MARGARAHDLVAGSRLGSPRIPGDRVRYALYLIKNRFDPPEAAAGEYGGFGFYLGLVLVNGGIRKVGRVHHSSGGQTGETRLEKGTHDRHRLIQHELSP